MSVLVVDADTMQRDALRAVLGDQYTLTFVAGLGEALRMVRDRRPDLLVSEVDLADGSGLDLCARIRELPGGRRMPIMLVTNRSSTADKAAGSLSDVVHIPLPQYHSRSGALVYRALRQKTRTARAPKRLCLLSPRLSGYTVPYACSNIALEIQRRCVAGV